MIGYYQVVIGAFAEAPGSEMNLVSNGASEPINNLSSAPGIEGGINVPGPGPYRLQVISSGRWFFALQYGENQFEW